MNKQKNKEMNSKIKGSKGITLVALIITIVVLLILAMVAIGALQERNIVTHAQNATTTYENALKKENELLADYLTEIESTLHGSTEGNEENKDEMQDEEEKEAIPTTQSYVGYYADVDGNGSVDGIIYADLSEDGSGQWVNEKGSYSYTKKEKLNNYYISKDSYKHEKFEEKPVIAPIDKGEGNDRFYVMALTDFSTKDYKQFVWYKNAYGYMDDIGETTYLDFGKGKENTKTMMSKNYNTGLADMDVWKHINDEVLNGWFVPSRDEWGAFADFMVKQGMIKTNYNEYGLSYYYLSSSQYNALDAWGIFFNAWEIKNNAVNLKHYVRLSTTF